MREYPGKINGVDSTVSPIITRICITSYYVRLGSCTVAQLNSMFLNFERNEECIDFLMSCVFFMRFVVLHVSRFENIDKVRF